MMRLMRSLPLSMAVAVLVCVAAAGCGTAANVHLPKSAPDAKAGFAGHEWQVGAIGHAGKVTPIPARYAVSLQFTLNGVFISYDSVNSQSGLYQPTSDGFTVSHLITTLADYGGHNPVVILAISAISAVDKGVDVKVRRTGDRLSVTAGGYLLTCQLEGRQAYLPRPRTRGVSTP